MTGGWLWLEEGNAGRMLEVQAGSSREVVARYGGARHERGDGRGWLEKDGLWGKKR